MESERYTRHSFVTPDSLKTKPSIVVKINTPLCHCANLENIQTRSTFPPPELRLDPLLFASGSSPTAPTTASPSLIGCQRRTRTHPTTSLWIQSCTVQTFQVTSRKPKSDHPAISPRRFVELVVVVVQHLISTLKNNSPGKKINATHPAKTHPKPSRCRELLKFAILALVTPPLSSLLLERKKMSPSDR